MVAPVGRKINYLYLANDLLQNSKQKKNIDFQLEFQSVLPQVIPIFEFVDSSTKKRVVHILDVWEERRVFSIDFCRYLKSKLGLPEEDSNQPYDSDRSKSGTHHLKETPALPNEVNFFLILLDSTNCR